MNQTTSGSTNSDFFGHPKGLKTLFLTEMWERMSYYGMRGILILFMTAALQDGGLAITVASATAMYGLYTSSVYFMGLPGGWLADRLIGGQRAIWYGGIIIMCGHIVLAIPNEQTFFIGLILVAIGTGLLKPNISALVGQLYSQEDTRRDSGYALYYMGINIGALIGYGVCGYLAENIGWHWAFGAAAVGMAFGLIQYRLTLPNLSGIGAEPIAIMSPTGNRNTSLAILAFIIGLIIITALIMSGSISINPIALSKYTAIVFSIIFMVYFALIYFMGGLNQLEKKGMWALLLICIASACFWSGFEQAGSSLNLFARDYTDRMLGSFEIPTAWFQKTNSYFIILLSPLFVALWINIGKRMVTPAYGIKCAIGLMIMASGFIAMFFAAQIAAGGTQVAAFWLILTYFLHSVGELCLSPIALSAVSKLSPRRFMGQMMGIFVLTYSIGNILAGLIAGKFDPERITIAEMSNLYLTIAIFGIGIGAVILALSIVSKNWEKQVEEANTSS